MSGHYVQLLLDIDTYHSIMMCTASHLRRVCPNLRVAFLLIERPSADKSLLFAAEAGHSYFAHLHHREAWGKHAVHGFLSSNAIKLFSNIKILAENLLLLHLPSYEDDDIYILHRRRRARTKRSNSHRRTYCFQSGIPYRNSVEIRFCIYGRVVWFSRLSKQVMHSLDISLMPCTLMTWTSQFCSTEQKFFGRS